MGDDAGLVQQRSAQLKRLHDLVVYRNEDP